MTLVTQLMRALVRFRLMRALGRNRTCDTRFRKPVLYPLSYEGGVVGNVGENSLGEASLSA